MDKSIVPKGIILATDSYKRVHWKMVPPGLSYMTSYGEPRVGGKWPLVCYLGMSMIVQDHFLQVPTKEEIEYAEFRSASTFGTTAYFNRKVWEKVKDLGFLPIKIRTAPEGSVIPEGNVCFTIESTRDWFASTVNSLEDLLMHIWYPTAVATRAMYIKKALYPLFHESSDIPDIMLPFAVNDFGLRGAGCLQAGERAGAAFLAHFMGSDNEPGQTAVHHYYGWPDRLKSVWATEHSVALSWGIEGEEELDYLKYQLTNSEPDKIVSVVIDTKDSDNFIQNIVGDSEIKQLIKDRPGRVVFRPDSGDPKTNVIKYLDMLGGIFGYKINSKGKKVLHDNVGLLQGDGMDEESIPNLYKEVIKAGWAADNFVTGSGGGLLVEGLTRDTSRWAIKPSFEIIDGVEKNVRKIPKTDMTKSSKAGKLKLHQTAHSFMTISSAETSRPEFTATVDCMEVVLEDGKYKQTSFKDVIERAEKGFKRLLQ